VIKRTITSIFLSALLSSAVAVTDGNPNRPTPADKPADKIDKIPKSHPGIPKVPQPGDPAPPDDGEYHYISPEGMLFLAPDGVKTPLPPQTPVLVPYPAEVF